MTNKAGRSMALLVTLAVAGCSVADHPAAPKTIEPAIDRSTTPNPSPSAPPVELQTSVPPSAAPTTTSSPTASPDWAAEERAQAESALRRWADFIKDRSADAVIFVEPLSHGGGGSGRHSNDLKLAFGNGLFEAAVDLPTEEPLPRDIVWPDGSIRPVELISAADAFDSLIAERRSGSECNNCLQVIGAKLASRTMSTTHGGVSVPVWQFEFEVESRPEVPITYAAVKNAISPTGWEGAYNGYLGAAYGAPDDTEITITFGGGACDSSHAVEAVESDIAIVPVITAEVRGDVCTANVVPYDLLMQLASPLGNRVVLDVGTGYPVPIPAERPPTQP